MSTVFAGGGELLLIGSKKVTEDLVFEEYGDIEEYLLEHDDQGYHLSKPINITSSACVLNNLCLTVSSCGMFLLVPMYGLINWINHHYNHYLYIFITSSEAPPKRQEPMYCSLSYGPAYDRDYLHLVSTAKEKDMSHKRSFSRTMQKAIHGSEVEIAVESSFKGMEMSVDSCFSWMMIR